MKVYNSYIIMSVFFLMLGACLYIIFRNPVIFTEPLVRYMDIPLIPLTSGFWSDLLRFTIPDALWNMSLLTYFSTIKKTLVRVVALLMAPLYEIGQLFGLFWGTFDYIDFIVYLIINIIFITKWIRKEK